MKCIIDYIFPFIENINLNREIKRDLELGTGGELSKIKNPSVISTELLRDRYEHTFKVKEKFEDKAKVNVIGLTISISLITGSYNLFDNLYSKFSVNWLKWLCFSVFVLAVFYMIIAGILAIEVLIKHNIIYQIHLETYADEESTLRKTLDQYTYLNNKMNLIRNNNIYTSYECIRNSLLFLFFLLVLSIIPL